MEKITEAARVHSGYSLNLCNPIMYDSFIAGATAPETEAYYKAKYSLIPGDEDYSDTEPDSLENARKKVMGFISANKLLMAVKAWKEANPGMGLKEAKDYVESLRK